MADFLVRGQESIDVALEDITPEIPAGTGLKWFQDPAARDRRMPVGADFRNAHLFPLMDADREGDGTAVIGISGGVQAHTGKIKTAVVIILKKRLEIFLHLFGNPSAPLFQEHETAELDIMHGDGSAKPHRPYRRLMSLGERDAVQ